MLRKNMTSCFFTGFEVFLFFGMTKNKGRLLISNHKTSVKNIHQFLTY